MGTFKNGFKGGVHMVTKPGQAREFAAAMLGQELVTKQAPNGIICNKVFLMERMYMRQEMYLSILMDRASQGPVLVASPRGGTSIEDVAASNPEVIFTEPIDLIKGIQHDTCVRMAKNLGLDEGTGPHDKAVALMKNLYSMFVSCDCTQVEINPLAETPDGDIVVCDAKVNFDDNAEYRQSTIFARRDITQEDSREVEASKYDLNYIGLDGNIGCMVNGAGLAMSTMVSWSCKRCHKIVSDRFWGREETHWLPSVDSRTSFSLRAAARQTFWTLGAVRTQLRFKKHLKFSTPTLVSKLF